TDNGRTEVEFENGTLAFLKENTVLEFYDLSLKDGALITRLVLRQGSASFHVNPLEGDYFSVTGGDFTVEVGSRATFRLDNFDDGVSGRIDTVSTATSAAMQYTSSPYYAPGFGSLYSYGSWFNCGAYGYGWRPFGVGASWSPFTDGQWIWDPALGWTWNSFQPW